MPVAVSLSPCSKVLISYEFNTYSQGYIVIKWKKKAVFILIFFFFLLFLVNLSFCNNLVNLFCRCCRREVRALHGMAELLFLCYFFRLLCALPIYLDAERIFLSNVVLDCRENVILVTHSWLNFVIWVPYVSCFSIPNCCCTFWIN